MQTTLLKNSPPLKREEKTILLQVKNLKKHYPIKKNNAFFSYEWLRAVDGIHFNLFAGETLGIVGESGCGKSTTKKLLLNVESPTEGEVRYHGQNVFTMDKYSLKQFRYDVQMIYQDPYSSLDPKWKVGKLISEPLAIHKIGTKKSRHEKVLELMKLVGLREEYIDKYVHEFSGGQRQRIGIARALSLDPKIIVADEPVSALDVSIQAQVINLLLDIKEKLNLTYIFISHDLSVIRYISDRVIVMYLGSIVEAAEKNSFFAEPLHPYAKALLASVPIPDPNVQLEAMPLSGEIPSPINPPKGCTFHPRCPEAMEICRKVKPEIKNLNIVGKAEKTSQKLLKKKGEKGKPRQVRCHLYA